MYLNAFKAGISPSSRIIVDELLDRYSLSASGQNYSMKASIPCLLVYQYIAKTPHRVTLTDWPLFYGP
ncbi:hypothetical protein OROHE_017501 [Orobanche hederae]